MFPVIYNSAMLGEMVILGILARFLYKKDLPDIGLSEVRPQEICIIADKNYNTIERLSKGRSSKGLEKNCLKQFHIDCMDNSNEPIG
jgi:hypothetical protein